VISVAPSLFLSRDMIELASAFAIYRRLSRSTPVALIEPSHRWIQGPADRGLDLAASDPDVAQFTVVPSSQRVDRSPALPTGRQGGCTNSDPADKSARPAGGRTSCGARENHGHIGSPIGFRPAKRCRWRKRWSSAAAPPRRKIALASLSAMSR